MQRKRRAIGLLLACLLLMAGAGVWWQLGSPVLVSPQSATSAQMQQSTHDARPAPVVQTLDLGQSSQKRPIVASVHGRGKRHVLILGGIHGDELHTDAVAREFAASLLKEAAPEDLTVIVVPSINPDGVAASKRVNANGVDLNRNFPTANWNNKAQDARHFPGQQPGSEPETRIVMKLIERYSPELLISIHAPLNCVNWDGPADKISEAMSRANGYPLKKDIGYPTPGSLGAYAGIEKGIPTVTLELRVASADVLVRENLPALRVALQAISGIAAKSEAASR
ncbi:MAG TPA: M14 family murein peptide amidase A [Pyrinomonadaceae bacterium]|nr:M14 family murein peptide amidase A [Pyrinomonadaceae bacterium]